MDCPSKNTIQDLIDDELSPQQAQQVIDHIRSCPTCKEQLREVLSLHHALSQAVNADPCPSLDDLEAYAASPADKKDATITEHIDLCHSCRSYLWALGASSAELADWHQQEQLAYDRFMAEELGYEAAQNALQHLLPDKIDLLEKTWDSLRAFIDDLRSKAVDTWPTWDRGPQLVTALGFADEHDPQTSAASVILITTLYISQLVADGEIEPTPQAIEAAIQTIAPKFGAGKELQKRLIKTIPPLILKHQ